MIRAERPATWPDVFVSAGAAVENVLRSATGLRHRLSWSRAALLAADNAATGRPLPLPAAGKPILCLPSLSAAARVARCTCATVPAAVLERSPTGRRFFGARLICDRALTIAALARRSAGDRPPEYEPPHAELYRQIRLRPRKLNTRRPDVRT
jgi:hypothetical protein